MMDDSGMSTDQRNTEILARATLNHVRIDDPDRIDGLEDLLPDDTVSYNHLQHAYAPPEKSITMPVKNAAGKYLQAPALHYSIGTRITPSMVSRLDRHGFKDVYVHDDPPPFKTEMPNLRVASHNSRDWMAKTHTSYLKSNLVDSAIRGEDTVVGAEAGGNIHFAPRLAVGVDFGRTAEETGKF
jgi:hypothetical protein